MALAHMICNWAMVQKKHIHLLTVNHNLRPESLKEVEQVGVWVQDFPVSTHHILTWMHDEKPSTAVMERARSARYSLMIEYCKTQDIQTLCVAHHADDQLETFLFRLAKGSGLDGLTGMDEQTVMDGVMLYRPLLYHTHTELIQYCKNKGLKWIEDPSNADKSYARPRIRKALQDEGFDAKRFAKTLQRLARGRDALDEIVGALFATLQYRPQSASDIDLGYRQNDNMELDWAILTTHPSDIQIRVLQKALMAVGHSENGYPPKLERVEEIVQTLRPGKSATLYGCVLSLGKNGNRLEIRPSKA